MLIETWLGVAMHDAYHRFLWLIVSLTWWSVLPVGLSLKLELVACSVKYCVRSSLSKLSSKRVSAYGLYAWPSMWAILVGVVNEVLAQILLHLHYFVVYIRRTSSKTNPCWWIAISAALYLSSIANLCCSISALCFSVFFSVASFCNSTSFLAVTRFFYLYCHHNLLLAGGKLFHWLSHAAHWFSLLRREWLDVLDVFPRCWSVGVFMGKTRSCGLHTFFSEFPVFLFYIPKFCHSGWR